MNLNAYIEPRSDSPPSGENLEYDQAFIEMEIVATPGQEQQKGDEIIPGEEPVWRDVVEKAAEVMGRSHDLRAGAVMAAGLLNTEGLPGLADGTGYVRALLEQYWDTCHPMLDADDDNDPTMRINAVKGLAANENVMQPLRRVPLTDSRTYGRLTLRDIQIAYGETPAPKGHAGPDKTVVRAAFEDTPVDRREAILTGAKAAWQNLRALDAIFLKQTPGYGPNLDEMSKLLQTIIRIVGEFVETAAAPEAEPEAGEETAEMTDDSAPRAATIARPASAPGSIASRDDVIAALDAIGRYYKDHEPSSPVPILLARARRLVKADFLEILKDLAPSGIDTVNMIGGLSDK
jgi:type VI secretion system protein ImpA